tara:strand:+ start:3907 stop:7050 length:3144 start_codon:yes stop_codon:yes gene_type:complete
MATYVNNLRLKEIATGDEEGTWGASTNTNLELIADAFGSGTEAITTNANTHTTTIADGAADEGRAIFLKYTGDLDSDCTITIAPNTVNKLWLIENATGDSGSSGPYNIIISQGSGANITIGNGKVAAVFTDGAGSGAAVLDAFADLELMTSLTVGTDAIVGDDLTLKSDAAVLGFGADTDVTLTHVADTGLLLNSTMAIQFNDASQYINAPSNAILDINATDEIELNATAIDLNGTLDVSGTITVAGNADLNGDLDVDGTTNLDAVDIDGAVQIDSTVTVGVDDTGYDVKFFGDTASAYMLWDTSTDDLVLAGAAGIDLAGDLDVDGTTNLDVVDIDGAVDMASTLTLAGNADFNGDLDVDGTTNLDVVDIDGAVDMATTLTLGGNADFNGDLDVDGTTNLDNTDVDGTLVVDGSNISLDSTSTLNIDNSNTSNGITIGTATSGVPVSIGHTTSEVTVNDNLTVTGTLTLGSGAELTEAELEMLDGITAGTVAASKAVVVDSNKDIASFRNVTLTGELDAGSLDISGDADIDGTTNLDAVDIDGAVQIDSTVTVGVDDTGYDVKFFGATSGAYMLWDESADDLVLAGAAGLDIAGDIDVDGTTNLDVVDIDGAVDMASTLTLGGTLTTTAGSIFNQDGGDYDFRVEGDTEQNLFFIDASTDRIGINTNTPTAKLHILQSAADYDSGFKIVGSDSAISGRIWMGGGHLNIDNATAGTGTGLTLEDDGTLTYGGDFLDVADGVTTIGGTDTSKLQFHNAAGTLRSFLTLNSTSLEIDTDSAIIFSANNSERARIDDQGRLGLGTSAPHGYYSVSNKFVIANTSGSTGMTFATSNTGQARIDFAEGTSGGEQYRGTIMYQHAATESEGYLRFVSAENEIFRMEGTIVTCGRTSGQASTVDGHQWFSSGGYYNYHAAGEVVRWYNTDNGNDVGSIDTSTSSTAYNTSSDRRLKENIEAADPSGSLIDSIEIVKHDWISSDDHVRYGVVAQDLFEVLPEAVSQGTDGDFVDEDLSKKEQPIKQVWGVDYSKLVPLLVKEVQDLRTRVAELEA